jgi:hypothetical protein
MSDQRQHPLPDRIQLGLVPDGTVMRFYDLHGRLILERTLSETRGTDWLRPAEATAAVDAGLAGLSLVLFDGDTGVRLPMIFGLACQLRPPAQP